MTPFKHPSNRAYEFGCRCGDCADWHRKRVAANRAARLAAGRLTHGTRSAYDAGCRCSACRSAKSLADHAYHAWKKDAS